MVEECKKDAIVIVVVGKGRLAMVLNRKPRLGGRGKAIFESKSRRGKGLPRTGQDWESGCLWCLGGREGMDETDRS